MPIALDPAQKTEFFLTVDRAIPEDRRPKFILRYLTCRQVLKFEQLVDEAAAASAKQSAANSALNKALRVLIAGWKNISLPNGEAVPFGEGDELDLDDVLTPSEKWELVIEGLRAIRLSESDKKKSLSQPAIATNASVPAAEANVPTNPAS